MQLSVCPHLQPHSVSLLLLQAQPAQPCTGLGTVSSWRFAPAAYCSGERWQLTFPYAERELSVSLRIARKQSLEKPLKPIPKKYVDKFYRTLRNALLFPLQSTVLSLSQHAQATTKGSVFT